MMKFTIVACLLVAPAVLAAVSRYPPEEKPACYADQEGCWLESLQRVLPTNVSQYPHKGTACDLYLCQADGVTIVETCGSIAIQDGCKRIPGDLNKEYPACCDFEQC